MEEGKKDWNMGSRKKERKAGSIEERKEGWKEGLKEGNKDWTERKEGRIEGKKGG